MYGVPVLILAVLIWSIEPNVNLPSLSVEKLVIDEPASNIIPSKVNLELSYFIITSKPANPAWVKLPLNITLLYSILDDKLNVAVPANWFE